jgi:hypothetical protein
VRRGFAKIYKELRESDDRLILLLGDISVGLFEDSEKSGVNGLVEGSFNIGILEQSMVSFAAGLAAGGFIPFLHTISPFLIERALEQIKLDVIYNDNKVILVSANGPFEYKCLGPTHHCPNDIPLLSLYTPMNLFCPVSESDLSVCLSKAVNSDHSSYVRLSNIDTVVLELPPILFGRVESFSDLSTIEVFVGETATLLGKTPFARAKSLVVSDLLGFSFDVLRDADVIIFYEPYSKPVLHERYRKYARSGVTHCSVFYPERIDKVFDRIKMLYSESN